MSLADYRKFSDEELVHRFKNRNDRLAIELLIERYQHLVLGVCMKYFKSAEDAQDTTQQIFIKLLDDLHKYSIEFFKSWLYMVAKNYCLMNLRGKKPQFVNIEEQRIVESESYVHHKEELEISLTLMEQSLSELKADQKKCIELFYLEGKSYAEICTQAGLSMMQVKSNIQNGKRNVKLIMEQKAKAKT